MYARTLVKETRVHRFVITQRPESGWDVREEADSTVVREAYYRDWHRVERMQRVFTIAVDAMRESGWTEA